MDVRTITGALFAFPLVLGACAAPPRAAVSAAPAEATPGPVAQSTFTYIEEGRFRVGGAANAAFNNTDYGDVETTTLGLSATGGKMVSPNVLVEGVVEYDNSSTDVGGDDLDQTSLTLGVGARYYFLIEGNTYPYAGGRLGFVLADLEVNGVEDDDSSPFLGFRVGAESFLTRTIALDYGLSFDYAFDIFDEDLTDLSLFFGLSLWF